MERTFVAVKPDAVQRGLVGEIISRFEKKGFRIAGMKLVHLSREKSELHYAEHKGKPFYEPLVSFITSSPIVVMAVEGNNAVEAVRKMMGATNPQNAEPGTIRADFAQTMERNVIHGADCPDSAEREIAIHFDNSELFFGWNRSIENWLF